MVISMFTRPRRTINLVSRTEQGVEFVTLFGKIDDAVDLCLPKLIPKYFPKYIDSNQSNAICCNLLKKAFEGINADVSH